MKYFKKSYNKIKKLKKDKSKQNLLRLNNFPN